MTVLLLALVGLDKVFIVNYYKNCRDAVLSSLFCNTREEQEVVHSAFLSWFYGGKLYLLIFVHENRGFFSDYSIGKHFLKNQK